MREQRQRFRIQGGDKEDVLVDIGLHEGSALDLFIFTIAKAERHRGMCYL